MKEIDEVPWFECKSITRLDLRADDLPIAYLELSSLLLTLLQLVLMCISSPAMLKRITRKVLVFKSDNSNVVSWMNAGRIKYMPWNRLLEAVFILELILQCKIITEWVEQQRADPLTRGILKHTFNGRTLKARKHKPQTINCFINLLLFGPNLSALSSLESLKARRDFNKPVTPTPFSSLHRPSPTPLAFRRRYAGLCYRGPVGKSLESLPLPFPGRTHEGFLAQR